MYQFLRVLRLLGHPLHYRVVLPTDPLVEVPAHVTDIGDHDAYQVPGPFYQPLLIKKNSSNITETDIAFA